MPEHTEPPIAPTEPMMRNLHGVDIVDNYAWMRDTSDPRFLPYLRAERAHYDRMTGHLTNLRDALSTETAHRLVPTDESVRWRRGSQFYYMKSVTGSEYEQFVSSRNPAEPGCVVLDDADLATEANGYVAVEVREVSPDGRLLAYAYDTDGDEVYTLRFRDIDTGTDLTDKVDRVSETGAWSADSSTFFYTVHDELYRPYQVWRHAIGADSGGDVLVYQEDDARFDLALRTTTSDDYIVIEVQSRDTAESYVIPADRPTDPPAAIRPRKKGIEYRIDHVRAAVGVPASFVIATNLGVTEFRLMAAPVEAPADWRELAAGRPGERLVAAHAFAGRVVLDLRREGFPLLRIAEIGPELTLGAEREIHPDVDAGRIGLTDHQEYDAGTIRVEVESIIEPMAWFDIDLSSGARALVKRTDVPGYDRTAYRTERRHAPAPDGTLIPVTLAWRSGTPLDGTAPCLMWGYGAYESCDDPWFDPGLVSVLDRGVVYALTSPRGGGENGRRWWLDGHLAAKSNTFIDHAAVANWLAGARPSATGGTGSAAVGDTGSAAGGDTGSTVDGPLVDPARIVTRGLSAGGLLQAAALNVAPQRWCAVVAEVPFVDVIGSMSDPSIPLTINEWEEWGDPRKPAEFAYLYAYSPYDNMPPSPRPRMLVTAALHDPRVLVHEPTKWVARLRATGEPGDELLFRVELGAGAHTGPAGRYAHVRYEAEVFAFVLDAMGLTDEP